MQNAGKKAADLDADKITVYSFVGSIIIPTEQGSYWANAIGGMIESRPVGNPYILFALKYIWNMAGEVCEFPEPIRIRLNTAMAVTETFDFKFPAPEAPAEETAAKTTPTAGPDEGEEDEDVDEDEEGDEDEEFDEDEEGDEDVDVTEEVEDELSKALHSDNEISW